MRLGGQQQVHAQVSLEAAQARAEEHGNAAVMVRAHACSDWFTKKVWDYYESGGSDGGIIAHRRVLLYLQQRLAQAELENMHWRQQMATMERDVPIAWLQDLPSEWRSMLSLRVEDVARELETILERWREQRQQKEVSREVAHEAAGDGPAAQREV